MDFFIDHKMHKFWITDHGIVHNPAEINFDKNGKGVMTATAFITACCSPRKTINRDSGSYSLKHRAEEFGTLLNEMTNSDIFESYVSNGEFIYAAISLKYSCLIDNGPNAIFNLSFKDEYYRTELWKKIQYNFNPLDK